MERMKLVNVVAILALTGCSLTPTQQKWAGVAAGVLIVGAIAAHNADNNGSGVNGTNTSIGKPGLPCTPQPDGTCR